MAARSISAAQVVGSTRGMFSGKPPPVMCASALMPRVAPQRGEQRLDVDAGRLEQRVAEVAFRFERRRIGPGEPRRRRRCGAPARTRSSERRTTADQGSTVAGADVQTRQQRCRARPRRPRSRRDRSPCRRRGPASPPSRRRSAPRRPRGSQRRCRRPPPRRPPAQAGRWRNNRGRTAARRPARRDR